MTKKNIQVILSILVLTLLSLGGLYYFSQQSKDQAAPQVQRPVNAEPVQKPSLISDVSFVEDEISKKITLSGVNKKNYRVRLFDAENGFSVLFPNANMNVETEYTNPLPWVQSVTFEQKQFRGQPSVEMTVSTVEGIALFDQFDQNSLVIELQNTKANVASKTPAKKEEVKEPAKAASTPKPKAKPKPRPVPVSEPEPIEEPEIVIEDSDPFVDESEDVFAPDDSSALGDLSAGNDEPVFDDSEALLDESDPSFDDSDSEELSIMDLETDFSLGGMDENEGSQEVAAIPSDDGKFDMGSDAQITMIQGMLVSGTPNGRTSVRFDRESSVPYKIFKLRNPARLVVDFKDATAGFDGSAVRDISNTSIDRVETQQFQSSDSKLLRVIMYMNKDPEYSSSKEGNALILDLP